MNGSTRRLVGAIAAAAIVIALCAVLIVSCGSGDDEPPPSTTTTPPKAAAVRQIFVVESSWFATNAEIISKNLDDAAMRMKTCGHELSLRCEVMIFAVQGGEVSAKRVPAAVPLDPKTGFWFSLDNGADPTVGETYQGVVDDGVKELVGALKTEIVPASHPDQPPGCVNLITTLKTALDELRRHPGDRNILTLYATGLTNCEGQPFYPGLPFPPQEEAASALLETVPSGSAVIDGHPVCIEWSPMFAQTALERGLYVSQEQARVMKDAWMSVTDQWGAVRANDPGEQTGSCLSMDGGR